MDKTISPFLPNTNIQYAWDSTSIGYLKTCPRLYKYHMIDGWASREESIHLRFGIEFHSALEDYDKIKAEQSTDHTETLRQTIGNLLVRIADWDPDTETKAGKYKNPRSLLRTVIDYLDFYENDTAKTVILDNGAPAVELSFRFELDYGPNDAQPYIVCGHLDRVVEFNEQLFVMDRKTSTTTLSSYYFNQYEPHNQMTLYTVASQIILGATIKGVIIDAAQIMINDSRFIRGITYRTKDQLEEWLADLRFWFNIAKFYAEQNHWPMNDTACDKFGGCRFREVCSKSPSVRKTFLAADFKQQTEDEKWNPLESR